MNKIEILEKVTKEMSQKNAWEVTHVEAKKRIIELFRENGIPEKEYKPFYANNCLSVINLA